MTITASAMEVRKNLGKLLNMVSLRHEEIIIERAGKPIARLTDPGQPSAIVPQGKNDFRKSRGIGKDLWRQVEAERYIAEEREQWD